jgi:tRNA threonylcarbamoyladenosine biosynthesis protein TsaE
MGTPLVNQIYESSSVEETERIASALAATLRGGECIALDGDLGAGKTQFVRGLVAGLGGDRRQVSSPTYVLLHIYKEAAEADEVMQPMRLPVYHLDAYRVSGEDELEAIGFSELLEQGGVVVVEWASRVSHLLSASRIAVNIQPTSATGRQITVHHPDQR